MHHGLGKGVTALAIIAVAIVCGILVVGLLASANRESDNHKTSDYYSASSDEDSSKQTDSSDEGSGVRADSVDEAEEEGEVVEGAESQEAAEPVFPEESKRAFKEALRSASTVTDFEDGYYLSINNGQSKNYDPDYGPRGLLRARIKGDELVMWSDLEYADSDEDDSRDELPYARYVFQLNAGTKYYYYEGEERYVSKDEFAAALEQDKYGPLMSVHVSGGVTQSVSFSA